MQNIWAKGARFASAPVIKKNFEKKVLKIGIGSWKQTQNEWKGTRNTNSKIQGKLIKCPKILQYILRNYKAKRETKQQVSSTETNSGGRVSTIIKSMNGGEV